MSQLYGTVTYTKQEIQQRVVVDSSVKEDLIKYISDELNKCGIYNRVFCRIKSAESLERKYNTKNYGEYYVNDESNIIIDLKPAVKKIQDLIGIRINLYFKDDLDVCKKLLENMFKLDNWSTSDTSDKEFSASKINGVFKLPTHIASKISPDTWDMYIDHTFEIQLKTLFFEGWHEIEHDMRYKNLELWEKSGKPGISRHFNSILATLELCDKTIVSTLEDFAYALYKDHNWDGMIRMHYRIKMSEEKLNNSIIEYLNKNLEIGKKLFKYKRDYLIELLHNNTPIKISVNNIVKLINENHIFDTKLSQIIDKLNKNQEIDIPSEKKILRIVLTGGPCAGKTTVLTDLTHVLENKGYKVFTIQEVATLLINSGLAPNEEDNFSFQKNIMSTQLYLEQTIEKAALHHDSDRIIIIYDRGICDQLAYISREKFELLLQEKGMKLTDAFNRYDAVLHLVTAADGAAEHYVSNSTVAASNNSARNETIEEAIQLDKATQEAWVGHPHLRVFENPQNTNDGMALKKKALLEEVFALLGEPVPSEIERKFLIKKPTEDQISSLSTFYKSNIVQTYLYSADPEKERRVRQRGSVHDGFSFYYTEKTNKYNGDEKILGERIEFERKITIEEYSQLLLEADPRYDTLCKTRYCFLYEKKYFELDIYPFSDDYAILEVEVNNLNDELPTLPDFLEAIEVTGNDIYSNSTLAKSKALFKPEAE